MTEHTTRLRIADSRAEVQYHLDADGEVVVGRIVNLDHGNPINVTTIAGGAFGRSRRRLRGGDRGGARGGRRPRQCGSTCGEGRVMPPKRHRGRRRERDAGGHPPGWRRARQRRRGRLGWQPLFVDVGPRDSFRGTLRAEGG
jgi:hypothetical protein